MPLLGSLKWGRAASARRDSVRMGMVARADAPAAKRKNERRERPLEAAGSIDDGICESPPKGNNREAIRNPTGVATENSRTFARRERKGSPHLKLSLNR